jgi:DNA-binding transcriptional LysR family regulator
MLLRASVEFSNFAMDHCVVRSNALDRFDALAALVTVVDQKGFAPAARRLGLSPSATTRLVASLEDRLKVRLLNRTTRSVSLTDAGARFLERARQILADLEEAELMAESESGEPMGRLVVSAPLVFGRVHVAPLMCDFMSRHPRLRGELMLSDRYANLVEDGIDVAIRIGHLADSGDVARRVGTVRRVLVASPEYLDRYGTPQVPADLSGHRLIAFTALTAPETWRFWAGGSPQDYSVTPAYVTNSADAAIWHACRDGGITLALSYQVTDHLRQGALRLLLPEAEPPPYPVQFVFPSTRLLSRKVRALLEYLVDTRTWDFLDM